MATENKKGTVKYKQGEINIKGIYNTEVINIVTSSLIQAGYDLEVEPILSKDKMITGRNIKVFKIE